MMDDALVRERNMSNREGTFILVRYLVDGRYRRRPGVLTFHRSDKSLAFLISVSLVLAVVLLGALLASPFQRYVRADSSDEWRSIGPFGISGPPNAPNLITSGPVGAIGHS